MNKYKICVYAICKNEESFVDRWYDSMKEADEIYVLDTGSTDNTVKKLKEHGVFVTTKVINPWRFDVARNKSLELVPENVDICVCTDLDEVLNKGWRSKLEKIWNNQLTRLKYIYNWSLDENDNPLVTFYSEKIHARNKFKWIHPVHEVLEYDGQEEYSVTDDIVVNHYPDNTKSRSNYLPLLELSVKENPNNDRNIHYLGREYMYYQKWNECIDTLIKHLNLPNSIWKDERCASMRFIARSYINLKRYNEAYMWLSKAIDEAPYLREPYVEYGLLAYGQNDYQSTIKMMKKALKIKTNPKTYINEVFCYNSTIDDILSICYYNIGDYKKSLKHIKNAIKKNSTDMRLKENKKIIMEKYEESKT